MRLHGSLLVLWTMGVGCAPQDNLSPVVPDPIDNPPGPVVEEEPIAEEPAPEEPAPSDSPAGATRSGLMIPGWQPGSHLVADADNDALLWMPARGGDAAELYLGGEPTRVVRYGDHLWVTLRAAGQIVELQDQAEGLPTIVRRVDVGAEPFDVVVSDDGARLWVSLSQQNEVIGLDTASLSVMSRWTVEGEPRWMAVGADPFSGAEQLAVVPMRGGELVIFDVATGRPREVAFPDMRRSMNAGCEDVLLTPRATGEVVWDEVEDAIWVAGSYVDIEMPATPAGVLGDPIRCPPPSEQPAYYFTPPESKVGRFNPVLVRVDLLGTVDPQAWLLASDNPHVDQTARVVAPLRGHPSSIELTRRNGPASLTMYVAFEGDGAVVEVRPYDTDFTRTADFHLYNDMFSVPVRGGATAVRADTTRRSSETFVWSRMDRVRLGLSGNSAPVNATPSVLPADVQAGRRLFMLSESPEVSLPGGGVVCASCHTDARADGLTWSFPDMQRQTPSLAGGISETAPYTWTADVDTVMTEARLTSELRMGGTGVTDAQALQLAAFLDSVRPVVKPVPTAEEQALIELGREVFHRPEVACSSCHNGPQGSGPVGVAMRGFDRISVPALQGIAATAPYFHDGSAATLRDVLDRSRNGSMGDTSSLDEEEMRALELYLRYY